MLRGQSGAQRACLRDRHAVADDQGGRGFVRRVKADRPHRLEMVLQSADDLVALADFRKASAVVIERYGGQRGTPGGLGGLDRGTIFTHD